MKEFKLELKDKDLVVEIRNLAEQANGSCFVRYGDTLVFATCTMAKEEKEDMGFFPLTVNYEEKYYASGKIQGSRFMKREGRPSDKAICNSRLIDRAIRPRFPEDLKREVQVIATVLSYDLENNPDVVALIASSLALSISDIPWTGPVAAVRVGRQNNEFLLNPTCEEIEKNEIDVVFAAGEPSPNSAWANKKDEEVLINMIEGNSNEAQEDTVLEAFDFSKKYLKRIIDFQKEITQKIGKEKIIIKPPLKDIELEKEIKELLDKNLEKALFRKDKTERTKELETLKNNLLFLIGEKYPEKATKEDKTKYALNFLDKEIGKLVHKKAISEKKRIDGRELNQVREIRAETAILPRTHGSGLFSRGQTKALSIVTLGGPGDQQLIEGMEIVEKKRFMHHYNFPPYSVGETRPIRGPGRRDIGHGMLAEKTLLPLLPPVEEFPYTIRVVSEILSSNGSTSMASVSGAALALMDAGVPIKSLAAGIAIGLMTEGENYEILTDIQGPEDHHGDMDFKTAGTKNGITAIQMDVKIEGITKEIFKTALRESKKARIQILEIMEKVIAKPRANLSPFAPRILTLQINPDKIGTVVGPGGKVINKIIEETGVAIDIEDSGLIYITSKGEESAEKAISWIESITREVKIGEIFEGKVKRILEFGAFVEILPNETGLIHISKLALHRVEKVEDIVKLGDTVEVKVISIDEQGRINLSLKAMKNRETKA